MRLIASLLLPVLLVISYGCDSGPPPATEPPLPAGNSSPTQAAAQPDAPNRSDATGAAPRAARPAPVPDPASWRFERGRHFEVITSARPRSTAEPIEVIEFFWYGCPFCFSFDPVITRWKETLPDDVAVVRVPVIWGADHERYGRLFYTAKALSRVDDLHPMVYREFHLEDRRLRNDSDVEAFFTRHGVSAEEFRDAWRSFPVTTNLNNARRLTSPAGFGINSTPMVVVNGRYKITGDEVRSFEDVLAVTEELIDRERQARLEEGG
ncbi:MAG: thiol:disulfide interchange protein DsbA/DsbL [Chromatiales bacterium]|nr:thiol:disulfide interchange protein DsbA/DsbL [Chromatiales bacterium]